ncbi:pimeloyl-ACP methyl ester carboxylesterase/aminoglycoside phosphotransferase (APT) family kinase protein [Streptomyces sp. LBL]|uniref:alpha/beta fold hydrolase n=1 Tax=Streptomyces sp. LBL TaxID=2940562 RepID=UPI002474B02F|nr:alpha/beta fold hydrolase [Streptomyces sp. LBL]MDH6626841.1 pimeloyl-ACP methyl ester carboxylesterase/aminoglycoside phosphotransferase (APT) family kinase protein [Streptomyces sp. LBL]
MSELIPFAYEHDGERLSGVYGGGGAAGVSGASGAATAVVLHGAGNGSKGRLLPLLDEFVARGCRGLALDFSGHGDSTGELRELSLRRRCEQAVAVIDAHVPADGPLILVGFSMSGQTVADLAAHYGDRVTALGLCAPAVYAGEAWDVPFGDGRGRFSAIIRTPGSWRASPALDVLRTYPGRAVLAVPGTDAVIPPEVTETVQDALCARAQFTRFELPDADHHLGLWLRDHAEDRREFVSAVLTPGWAATRSWVAKQLPPGRTVVGIRALSGGWSSQMRCLTLDDGTGLVLRTFVKPFFRRHATGLLAREASVLAALAGQKGIPAARPLAVDASAELCDHPSLLMSLLPGRVRVDEEDTAELERRLDLLAAQLVRIHRVVPDERPRAYQAWTSPERARTPPGPLWERAVDVIRREPPPYEGCFLHRDFHPGNVLFDGRGDRRGDGLRISGVVDWVETSWGPADLDVAHCSTALALLHGPEYGLDFRARYEARGGHRLADGPDHLYWRLLDALAYSPDAAKLAGPWRELGRTDLTPEVLGGRLERYVAGLLEAYA